TDSSLREAEYHKAIKKWISLGYPIIFCENSNYDSAIINEEIKGLNHEKFEYLKFTSSVSHLGKGYGEAEIIDYTLKNSKLIKDDTIICKMTGKNYVTNAKVILRKLLASPHRGDMVTAILGRNLTIADSRFFFFKRNFYLKYWINIIPEIDEPNKVYIEHTLARAIHIAIAKGERWSLLPELPIIEGFSGTYAKPYKNKILHTVLNKFYYLIVLKAVSGKR
ncbi:MAG TPA: hypothetical protein VF623_15790, partial [Segetibacter sp.]